MVFKSHDALCFLSCTWNKHGMGDSKLTHGIFALSECGEITQLYNSTTLANLTTLEMAIKGSEIPFET